MVREPVTAEELAEFERQIDEVEAMLAQLSRASCIAAERQNARREPRLPLRQRKAKFRFRGPARPSGFSPHWDALQLVATTPNAETDRPLPVELNARTSMSSGLDRSRIHPVHDGIAIDIPEYLARSSGRWIWLMAAADTLSAVAAVADLVDGLRQSGLEHTETGCCNPKVGSTAMAFLAAWPTTLSALFGRFSGCSCIGPKPDRVSLVRFAVWMRLAQILRDPLGYGTASGMSVSAGARLPTVFRVFREIVDDVVVLFRRDAIWHIVEAEKQAMLA